MRLCLAPGIRTGRPLNLPLSLRLSEAPGETRLANHAAVDTRSHWIQLLEAASSTPTYASVVGEESDVKPAADKV